MDAALGLSSISCQLALAHTGIWCPACGHRSSFHEQNRRPSDLDFSKTADPRRGLITGGLGRCYPRAESEVIVLAVQLCLMICDPHGLQPARVLCPWHFPGKNAGVGSLSQGDLPDPGIQPGSLTSQTDSLLSEPPQKPKEEIWGDKLRIRVYRYILLYIKQINHKDLLYRAGNYIQYLLITWKKSEKECICVHIVYN